MAYWNLGYMYENALGVPQDWHLAKRWVPSDAETCIELLILWFSNCLVLEQGEGS